MKFKLDFDYCCFEAEPCPDWEGCISLSAAWIGVAAGVFAHILCIELLKLSLPTLLCLLYALHEVITEGQVMVEGS